MRGRNEKDRFRRPFFNQFNIISYLGITRPSNVR